MTIGKRLSQVARGALTGPIPGAPPAEFTIAPTSGEDAAAVLGVAAEHRLRVLFWGAGTHQGMGYKVEPDIVLSTHGLDRVVDWQLEDLTVVVQPGVRVTDLEAQLQQEHQTAVLPEMPGMATVGGTVAAGASGWRRLRYGPIRDRMLEVRLATGDGRLIRGGGRLVKNVTGYDLPRLAAGSFGSLGMITEMCLKLWPHAAKLAMVAVADPARALQAAYRPMAVIETNTEANVYLTGPAAELEAQAESIGGDLVSGHRWPEPLAGAVEMALRVPPGETARGVASIRELGAEFQAAHGIGEIRFVADGIDVVELHELRQKAEDAGGGLVVAKAPDGFDFDPWGSPPDSADLQRRVKAAFDPVGIANPGILPGGI